MMYSNRQILVAVLNKWGQPLIQSITGSKLMQLPFIANIEAKIKSTGWVSPMWKLSDDIAPLLGNMSGKIIEPFLAKYLEGIPDEAIPTLAHSLVDNALKNGSLSLMEGNVVFEKEDLEELKALLRFNLPINNEPSYEVITEDINN